MTEPTAINSTIIGAAGEHYVMCQLLRRGMIAALAPAGVPDTDIIVSNKLGSSLAAVHLKLPGKGGQEHNATVMRSLMHDYSQQGLGRGKGWLDP